LRRPQKKKDADKSAKECKEAREVVRVKYFDLLNQLQEAEDNVGVEQTVQPGDARIRSPSVSTSGNPPLSDTSLIGGPRVEYPQGEAATCVFMAAANALNEYGFTMAAAKLEGLALKSLEQTDIMEHLLRTIREHFKGFHASGIPGSYDPLTDDSPHPVVFTPRGSDHSSTHAVCKVRQGSPHPHPQSQSQHLAPRLPPCFSAPPPASASASASASA
jgi:hypothetical protein